jgi:glycosyltransferase involved in cell wall biosynthesis
MITNHGVHEWKIVPGLRDTGGQNVFVNQFSEALARQGFRVTTVNRGGYRHPVHERWQRGHSYKDQHQRIYYLEDDRKEFVRKEDMHEQVPHLAGALSRYVSAEAVPIDVIISHYWDAAAIGILFNRSRENKVRHYWVPHSLGALKKRNLSFPLQKQLRIDERIAAEKKFIDKLDGIAATSSRIQRSLVEDYGYSGPELFLPPCVDTDRYHPRALGSSAAIWRFLSEQSGLAEQEIQNSVIITEISRTDSTKGKDILIRAFAEVQRRYPQTVLIVSIDENQIELAAELNQLIRECPARKRIITVGSIWDQLPDLYAVTAIYCTPSRQEGFGMSAQEASATAVPVIASDRVPFVDEYLLGEDVKALQHGKEDDHVVRVGQGAIQVPVDEVAGFSYALGMLLSDETARKAMGERAYALTIPAFTWENAVRRFLQATGIPRETQETVRDE